MVFAKFMPSNTTKFQFMLMKKYTSKEIIPDSIEIHCFTNMRQAKVKLLGITIDQKLKFDKHVDNLCKNAPRIIHII